jgi:hypothetical protein
VHHQHFIITLVLLAAYLTATPVNGQVHLEPEVGAYSACPQATFSRSLSDSFFFGIRGTPIVTVLLVPGDSKSKGWMIFLTQNIGTTIPLPASDSIDMGDSFPSSSDSSLRSFRLLAIEPRDPAGMGIMAPPALKDSMVKHNIFDRYDKAMTESDALALRDAFFMVISNARFSSTTHLWMDAATYHFSAWKSGCRSAKIDLTPDAGRIPRRLIRLADSLLAYAKTEPSANDPILQEIRHLVSHIAQ